MVSEAGWRQCIKELGVPIITCDSLLGTDPDTGQEEVMRFINPMRFLMVIVPQ